MAETGKSLTCLYKFCKVKITLTVKVQNQTHKDCPGITESVWTGHPEEEEKKKKKTLKKLTRKEIVEVEKKSAF